MGIAKRLRRYLDQSGLAYEVLPHPHSSTSLETAREAHVAPERLVKPVLLEDESGYLMAVVPASHRVDLKQLGDQLQRQLVLANEEEIGELFPDCETGAMPPVGTPYRVPTIYADCLEALTDVYFEAGDHEDVVHMSGRDFLALLEGSLHGSFSHAD